MRRHGEEYKAWAARGDMHSAQGQGATVEVVGTAAMVMRW
jgi:hypothetical protein